MATKAELQSRVTALERDNVELKNMLARAERELNNQLHDDELPPEEIPYRIQCLIKSNCMPWEIFWCNTHRQWIDEFDSSFPYHMEGNECPGCRGEDSI